MDGKKLIYYCFNIKNCVAVYVLASLLYEGQFYLYSFVFLVRIHRTVLRTITFCLGYGVKHCCFEPTFGCVYTLG